MLYKFQDDKVFTNSIEYSVSYHCNLRCWQCSHLSPFVDKQFPEVKNFEKDIYRLSEVLHSKVIRLLGGEPLLNPDIDTFIKIAKKSKIADKVLVTTNGLLLHRMSGSFWKNVDYVLVSLYPGVNLQQSYSKIKQISNHYGTHIWFQMVSHFRTTIVTKPHKKDWITRMIYRSCRDAHFFHCHMVHDGWLYKCALPPFLPQYLAKLKLSYDPSHDGLAIHKNFDLLKQLKAYLIDSSTNNSCRYCLGYVGERKRHHQISLKSYRKLDFEPITRKMNIDYFKFSKEVFGYFQRRLIEILTKKKLW